MAQAGIEPQSVRTPIQLLGAWWAGLILIDTAFLTAATQIASPSWAAGALVAAAIAYVPLVIMLLFYMQTRFRAQLLTGSEYLQHLEITASHETGRLQIVEASQAAEIVEMRGSDTARDTRSIATPSGVSVNDLLPRFREIVAALREAEVRIDDTFGSTSVDTEVPRQFILTFGRNVDIQLMQRVISVLLRHGLQGVHLSLREQNEDQLYIGAYNYRVTPERVHAIDAHLRRELLSPSLSRKRLFQLLSWKDASSEPVLDEFVDVPAD